jgi:hypothetical protein
LHVCAQHRQQNRQATRLQSLPSVSFFQLFLIAFEHEQSLVQYLLIGRPGIIVPRLPGLDVQQCRYLFFSTLKISEAISKIRQPT